MKPVEIISIDNSLGIQFSDEMLDILHVCVGDEIQIEETPTGFVLLACIDEIDNKK